MFFEQKYVLVTKEQLLEMKCDNPLNIPLERLSETEGALKFVLLKNNLFDSLNQYVCFFSVRVGKSSFALFRDNHLNLTFVHKSPKTKTRIAVINLYGLSVNNVVYINIDWSREQSHLYVSDMLYPDELKHCKADETIEKADIERSTVPASGTLSSLFFSEKSLAKGYLGNAKGLWDWSLADVNNVINGLKSCKERQCPIKNPVFEVAVIKQCVVMLVRAWEVYAKKRFAEMEMEGKKPNIEALISKFGKNLREDEISEYISSTGKSKLASLLEIRRGRLINFLNYKVCKDAYNKGYGIRFDKLPNVGHTLAIIQSYIELRNVIIHDRNEPILGSDPFGVPIFLHLPFIENAVDEFSRLVEILHVATE